MMSIAPGFYICPHCKNVIAFVKNEGQPVICCGEEMKKLIPNTTDAAVEKHVPVFSRKCGKVTVDVGSVPHPMTEEHFIEWIYLATETMGQRKVLKPGDEPKAEFSGVKGPFEVYAFCNLHGLWMAESK